MGKDAKEEDMNFWDICMGEFCPESSKVDVGRYILKHKHALRFPLKKASLIRKLDDLAFPGFFKVFEGMLYIARTPLMLDNLIKTDNDIFPHEISLGKILGYPNCCARNIQKVGEKNIDEHNSQFNKSIQKRSFLDISRYTQGVGLISHVPCSPSCKISLRQAYEFYCSLKNAVGTQKFCDWRNDVIKYFAYSEKHP